MIRSIVRAVTLGAAAIGALAVAQAASATTYMFDFTNKGTFQGSSATFSATVGGDTLGLKATAWHANDPNQSSITTDSISSATLGYYSGAGMGVLFGNDTASNGTHQIDNVGGGVDFVMLQFSQDVTLSSIGRNVYSLSGVSPSDSDAAYWADTTNVLGAPSSTANVNLAGYTANESIFTGLDAGSGSLGTNKSASVWLVSAAFNQSNDGFKLSNLVVNGGNPTPAVPEPASWALMLVGFGAVGASMRRRKAALPAIA